MVENETHLGIGRLVFVWRLRGLLRTEPYASHAELIVPAHRDPPEGHILVL